MKRDKSVTVTRDIRVTSQVPRHVTFGVLSRVSHATTTTPHHTMSVLAVVCGVCGSSSHSSHGDLGSVPAPAPTLIACSTKGGE